MRRSGRGSPDDPQDLEGNVARLNELPPGMPIYLWDFGVIKPMPVDQMQRQGEVAEERGG